MARALGWPAERILVIDDDQGQSGQGAEHRSGFQRLLAEVTMDHIGLVIGLDMSRLARSSKDWHQLFELCGIFGALLADEDGVYDANDPTDRMILGLKGIMSELELHTMRNRLHRGAMNKARRGELFHSVATGYVILPSGEVVMDPDEQVRAAMQQIFDKFDEVGSVFRTFHWFARQHIALPLRCRCGSKKGELEWRRPTMTRILNVLHNPIYAGAYAYGRFEYDRKSRYRSPEGKEKRRAKPLEEWTVLIKDRLPAYITWDRFVKNQEQMRENQQKSGTRGVARHGSALLTTVLACGHCHWKMNIKYAAGDVGQYVCESYLAHGTPQTCTSLTSLQIDRLVTQQVLTALDPRRSN